MRAIDAGDMATGSAEPGWGHGSSVSRSVKVEVLVHGKRFTIACGRGTQTIAWLANTASQRFSASLQSSGRAKAMSRTPGSQGGARVAAFYLPQCVRRKRDTVRLLAGASHATAWSRSRDALHSPRPTSRTLWGLPSS